MEDLTSCIDVISQLNLDGVKKLGEIFGVKVSGKKKAILCDEVARIYLKEKDKNPSAKSIHDFVEEIKILNQKKSVPVLDSDTEEPTSGSLLATNAQVMKDLSGALAKSDKVREDDEDISVYSQGSRRSRGSRRSAYVVDRQIELAKLENVKRKMELEAELKRIELDRQHMENEQCIKRMEIELRQKELEMDREVKMTKLNAEIDSERVAAKQLKPKVELRETKNILPFLPEFNEQSVEEFFEVFEDIARIQKLQKPEFVEIMQCKLKGRAAQVIRELNDEDRIDYDSVKKLILEAYVTSPESYRINFRTISRKYTETYLDYAFRLKKLFNRWIDGIGAQNNFELLREAVLMEQFLEKSPPDVQ